MTTVSPANMPMNVSSVKGVSAEKREARVYFFIGLSPKLDRISSKRLRVSTGYFYETDRILKVDNR